MGGGRLCRSGVTRDTPRLLFTGTWRHGAHAGDSCADGIRFCARVGVLPPPLPPLSRVSLGGSHARPRASSRVCVSVLALAAARSARAEEMQSTHDVLFGCVVYPWLAWLVRWLLVLTSSQCLSPLLRFDYSFLNSSLQQLVQ